MELSIPSIQIKSLNHSESPEDYKLYKAGLEWALIEPIVIDDRSDIRSESKWRELLEPYNHQVTNLITFCRRLPVTLLADDVGLGKTISAGLILSELISRNRVSKILIVCPKILIEQWKEELDVKFGIPSIRAIGNELVNIELPEEACAVITTYNSARMRFEDIAETGYDMLILDEAHKLRNLYGVDQPPQVALRFRQALADRLFKYVLMLTATPIQNRLWDLYSLVDLLTVARGHENPFGSQGMFARKFIADNRTQARHLKPEMKDEFRAIVYGYMSRVRRGEANLQFPERIVQLHKVIPSSEEIELINVIAEPIQHLNYLSQIVILQALISSPEALTTMLNGMARKGTVPSELAENVREVTKKIKITAKLKGLASLVKQLKKEQSENFRMVIFTRWRETQTTIQAFLESEGIACGLINGDSSQRNQENIKMFKQIPPEINVIVSTEAGSEGINLQAANVLVNYDLPWNPMIVEQRIGRIQRLASTHANVCIFNITLQGTFEEYIVARLIEKLQMASHAIGDIESLLEATGLDDDDGEGAIGFEEQIRKLVIASLAGQDIELATRSTEKSITEAKLKLEQEEANINNLLGGMNPDLGPRCPKLPNPVRSMDVRTFVLKAFKKLGAEIAENPTGIVIITLNGRTEFIRFDNDIETLTTTLYTTGSPAFERLVDSIVNNGLHNISDADLDVINVTEGIIKDWVTSFNGEFIKYDIQEVNRSFDGVVLLRIRATVAHDSYERLIEIECLPEEHTFIYKNGLDSLPNNFNDPASVGIVMENLNKRAMRDSGISEFCRFYLERMNQEVESAGNDYRKRKKLEDDFTPRIEISLVGLEGKVRRILKVNTNYSFENEYQYSSSLLVNPSLSKIVSSPLVRKCEKTGRNVPQDCLEKCQISKKSVLKHLLVSSELSSRLALQEHIIICSLSGKKVLEDEVTKSTISGEYAITALLKTSVLSGEKAEPKYFFKCGFTGTELLESELAVSQISGKKYRIDEKQTSTVSGKTGHKQEFIVCSLTKQPILESESEKCEITGRIVAKGLLQNCEISGLKVIPSELEKSDFSGKNALKKYTIKSSISGIKLFGQEAVRSSTGKYCTPLETKACLWSGGKYHPEDLKICYLCGLPVYLKFTTTTQPFKLETLNNLLNGLQRNADLSEKWEDITIKASQILGGKCRVETSALSPDGNTLAVSLEVRRWGGLKVRQAGFLFMNNNISGKIALGKRENNVWKEI